MKLLYTHENRFLVSNIQNIVENAGINIILKNEYAGGGAGDLVPHETWLEIWVDETDFMAANNVITSSFSQHDEASWSCQQCQEVNDASFEFCWNCQNEAH
jgi:hypothetical protein